MPVLVDEAQALLAPPRGRVSRHVRRAHEHGAGAREPDPRERLDELGLTVPLDARDPEDLALPHLEAHFAHGREPPARERGEARHAENGLAGVRPGLVDVHEHGTADHELGDLLGGRLLRLDGPNLGPAAHDGHAVREGHDLAELVRDEDDRLPLVAEPPEDADELVDLAGRQDGGGLVEDENARPAVEDLQDLDALLLADREVFYARVGVDRDAERLGELLDLAPRRSHVEDRPVTRLRAEDEVLGDGEDGDEHEVLVHHAHAALDRLGGVAAPERLPLDEDLALVRRVEAGQDLHQSRLAGAVLAHERVDLARARREVDAVVREDAREALRDGP